MAENGEGGQFAGIGLADIEVEEKLGSLLWQGTKEDEWFVCGPEENLIIAGVCDGRCIRVDKVLPLESFYLSLIHI